MGRSNEWFLRVNDETFGPETVSRLVEWAKVGRIQPGQEISLDQEVWYDVEEVPFLDMRWSIDIGDGNLRGPFRKEAADALVRSGRLPPASRTVEVRPPFENMDFPPEPEESLPPPEPEQLKEAELELPAEEVVAIKAEPVIEEPPESTQVAPEAPPAMPIVKGPSEEQIKSQPDALALPEQTAETVEKKESTVSADGVRLQRLERELAISKSALEDAHKALEESRKSLEALRKDCETRIEAATKEAQERLMAVEKERDELRGRFERSEAEYQARIAKLSAELKQVPIDAATAAAATDAAFSVMQAEVEDIAKLLEEGRREAETARQVWTKREDKLIARRQELLQRMGDGPESMLRRNPGERHTDPQTIRLRDELENAKVELEVNIAESKRKIRELSERADRFETENLRLRPMAAEAMQSASRIQQLKESLARRERELTELRQTVAEERKQQASSTAALMARINQLEGGMLPNSGLGNSAKDYSQKSSRFPGWMQLKQ